MSIMRSGLGAKQIRIVRQNGRARPEKMIPFTGCGEDGTWLPRVSLYPLNGHFL
jgi:hypothetical protein